MNIPTMLTIKECAKEFDGTGLTAFRIRQLALNNEMVHVRAGKKILINADRLCDFLNNPPSQKETSDYGKIRRIAER